MTEIKIYQVNYLLTMSRLPDHFYAMIYNLRGKDAIYKNPGVSLRSFVIAKCIRQEEIFLTGDMLNLVAECEEFSTNTQNISTIVSMLTKAATDISLRFVTLPPKLNSYFSNFSVPISDRIKIVKLSFDTFIMTSDPAKDHVDIMSPQAITLKTELFALKDLIDTLTDELSDALSPK